MTDSLQPTRIRQIILDVYPAFGLLAAIELGVFTALDAGEATVDEAALRIGVEPVRLSQLLSLLVDAGLLEHAGGRFRNTAETGRFLVRDRPTYIGGMHELWRQIWTGAMQTAASIAERAPRRRWMSLPDADKESYLRGLGVLSRTIGQELTARWDLRSYRSLVDVAGGSGALVQAVLDQVPGMRGAVIEHPVTVGVTRKLLAEQGGTDRVEVIAADVVDGEPTGRWDVAVVRNFIQMLTEEEAARALVNIGRIVEPGGCLFVCDMVLDDDRLGPREVLRLGIIFVNFFDRSPMYTDSQYRRWLERAGFGEIERVQSPIGHVILRARKLPEDAAGRHAM